MENKKTFTTALALTALLLMLVGGTFAFFRAQQGGTSTREVSVTSNTTDNLSFTIGNDITFTASEANFGIGGTNVSGSTSASAILTPNNKTNQATMNYYMYLNLTSNPTVYSTGNTNEDAELVLQVFDGSNQLVTLTGLGNQVALGNGYGYDITGVTGLITLLDNHAITANGSSTTENWSIVITLVNLNLDQNDNTNKTITGTIIMQKDPEVNFDSRILGLAAANGLSTPGDITLTNGYIYYHNGSHSGVVQATDEDGYERVYETILDANDGSYRYAGANPNNYVCFGSTNSSCPADNLYRIIGIMPVSVVTDNSNPNNLVTETQYLYKIVKNDYETETTLGITKAGNAVKYSSYHYPFNYTYSGPAGNNATGDVDAFYWNGTYTNQDMAWSTSTLNTVALNTNVLTNFGSTWSNKIANVLWNVGGVRDHTMWSFYSSNPAKRVYYYEILHTGEMPAYGTCAEITSNNVDDDPIDGWCEGWMDPEYFRGPINGMYRLQNKIGLMYVSDYLYAAPTSNWYTNVYFADPSYIANPYSPYQTAPSNYGYNESNNWLFRDIAELSITAYENYYHYEPVFLDEIRLLDGYNTIINNSGGAVRRTFYLTQDTVIDMDNYDGTAANPYRIVLN